MAALLQMNEAPLLTTCHSIQVARILKWRVARMYSAEVLLKVRPQHYLHAAAYGSAQVVCCME